MDNKKIGKKLQELRHKGGYKQEQLAYVLCISRSGYSQYETGIRTLSPDKLIALADFYGITVDQILEHNVD
ncbi:MAG: helix-turn-helix transcriptional regulator [Lachnospiraceae bacterium]|nr:helix-turn-helix transcriptional regulator [Lachnospiraceae bacterium]